MTASFHPQRAAGASKTLGIGRDCAGLAGKSGRGRARPAQTIETRGATISSTPRSDALSTLELRDRWHTAEANVMQHRPGTPKWSEFQRIAVHARNMYSDRLRNIAAGRYPFEP